MGIFSFIGDLAKGALNFVTGGLSDTIIDGIKTGAKVVGDVVHGIGDVLTDTGIASLLTMITTLTTSIDSVVTGVVGSLGAIVDPIKNVVDSVKTLSTDINDKIVVPIIKPITDTISQISGLTKTIDRLVDEGIGGIIKIPAAISDALTGIEASWDRATTALARANAAIVSDTLVPGIKDAVAPGLGKVSDHLAMFTKALALDVDDTQTVKIETTLAEGTIKNLLSDVERIMVNPVSFRDKVVNVGIYLFRTIVAVTTTMISLFDEGEADARIANPAKVLDPGSVLGLWKRRIFSTPDALLEIRRSGLNESRARALMEGLKYLPGSGEALSWWRHGMISEAERNQVLSDQGWNDADIAALVGSTNAGFGPDLLFDMYARGVLSEADINTKLRSQGYTDASIEALRQSALSEPQINTQINAYWNQIAVHAGWFADTYGSAPPASVILAGKRTRTDPAETVARWQSQFAAFPIQTAIQLFFRGDLQRTEVETVVMQNGFPKGMADLFIKSQTPLIPARSIPALVAKGELSKIDGQNKLEARGFSIADAALLIAAATDSDPAPTDAPPTEQSKVTVAQIRTAYKDGIIDEETARGLMAVQGLADFDIEFYVAQDNYDLAVKATAAEVDTIKSEVQLGVLSVDDATSRLFELNLPEGQVAKVLIAIDQAQRANAKFPDLGLLKQMAKAGYVSEADFLSGVQTLGYGAPWDKIITALSFTPGADNGDTSTA